jgi:hypothetical protein
MRSTTMEKTFVVPRSKQLTLAFFFIMSCPMSVLMAYGIPILLAKPFSWTMIVMCIPMGMLISGPFMMAWGLVHARRYRLIIRHNEIVEHGVLRENRLLFDDITSIRWWTFLGAVELRSHTQKLAVCVGPFHTGLAAPDCLWIIRFIHRRFPDSMQHDWAPFCKTHAVNFVHQCEPTAELMKSTFVLRRSLWDWMFVPFVFLVVGVAIIDPGRSLAGALLSLILAAIWIFAKLQTPKCGMTFLMKSNESQAIGAVFAFMLICMVFRTFIREWIWYFILSLFIIDVTARLLFRKRIRQWRERRQRDAIAAWEMAELGSIDGDAELTPSLSMQ